MDAARRLCTLALWLYHLGLACLTWVTGFMGIVAASALWRGGDGLLGAGLVVIAWLVTVLPAWREVIALRRDLFRAWS